MTPSWSVLALLLFVDAMTPLVDVTPAPEPQPACGPEMVPVEGEYCPVVRQTCLSWMEPTVIGGDGRCARFAPSECEAPRVRMRFCVDRDEYTPPGTTLPANGRSWTNARDECAALGKRLCRESEWNFACEGEAMLPYPTGSVRDSTACNFDRYDLLDERGLPRDLRRPSSRLVRCVSPFGVRSMVGNVDEWTVRDVTWGPHATALKGGWWLAGRNRCRPATVQHDEYYRDFQTGFRCCRDAPDPELE